MPISGTADVAAKVRSIVRRVKFVMVPSLDRPAI
jgi:hypothetical protein